jgi:catechol 2,3-dioxygenase-like lactoylglutathione lyase family enzyme
MNKTNERNIKMQDTLKTHIALNTPKFQESVEFYKAFLGIEPVKQKPGYAKFDVANPSLNLTLNQSKEVSKGALNHLGIQVASSDDVWAAKERFKKAGIKTEDEKDVICCYALQDKVWVKDPNGYDWEVFVVKVLDTGIKHQNQKDNCCQEAVTEKAVTEEACCEESCCS